jgi:hypothetical protein
MVAGAARMWRGETRVIAAHAAQGVGVAKGGMSQRAQRRPSDVITASMRGASARATNTA